MPWKKRLIVGSDIGVSLHIGSQKLEWAHSLLGATRTRLASAFDEDFRESKGKEENGTSFGLKETSSEAKVYMLSSAPQKMVATSCFSSGVGSRLSIAML
ncbi:hypothetical protein Nepgr_008577 [Nepenthes gracilis]|uniref:Uncharacterized protein n=1 Tax=Nepenthes gracilis TaxID=150966 RepID=A0AAD3S9S2_NEPGR|nr:hypothetical protein Nepgr_008577 [Nepenthes gracilis]